MTTTLTDLAKALNVFSFPDPDHACEKEFISWVQHKAAIHHVRQPTLRYFFHSVQIYAGGKNRTIGITKRGADAARFADMAVVRFAKYRPRANKILDGSVLNFDEAQVASDEVDCPEAVELLNMVEQHFLGVGIFVPPGDPDQKVIRTGRSIKGDIAFIEIKILAGIEDIKNGLQHIHDRLAALEKKGPLYIATITPTPAPMVPMYPPPSLPDPGPGDDPNAPIVTCAVPYAQIISTTAP